MARKRGAYVIFGGIHATLYPEEALELVGRDTDYTQKITPFLWFDGKAEEAMNFYISVFKNSAIVSVTRYGEEGPGAKGTVMTATFQRGVRALS